VAHRVDAGEQAREQVGVADVAVDELVRARPLRDAGRAVGLGEQRVEQDEVVAVGGEMVGDVGADEARSTRDQDARSRKGRAPRDPPTRG